MPIPDPVALTQTLVRIDTVSPPGFEDRCVEPLAEGLFTDLIDDWCGTAA